VSVLSAGCVVWLQRLQPLFISVVIVALAYGTWLVVRRPPQARSRKALTIFWTSVAINIMIFAAWGALWLRYR
jgi:uncharacterized membrane protein YeiH